MKPNKAKRVGRWVQKLTSEMKTWAMERLACSVASTQVVKEIYDKYKVTISDGRIRAVRDSKAYFPIFDAFRKQYLKEVAQTHGITMAAKQDRLDQADRIGKKLMKLIDKIDLKMDDDFMDKNMTEGKIRYVKDMVTMLKDTAKIYKDFLSYAKDETTAAKKEDNYKERAGSFLTGVTHPTPVKQTFPLDRNASNDSETSIQ